MAACYSCTPINSDARRFCAACGASLPLICAACGFENRIGERFCGGCGDALKAARALATGLSPYAATSGAAGAPPGVGAAVTRLGSDPGRQPITGGPERRHLSIMFCDLVGSADLAGRLDPEDLRRVIRSYQRAASDAIHRYEGYVARFLGDGIMAYFGYPSPHEHNAERALRAGLDVIAAVGKLNAQVETPQGVRYAVRVGVATGLAVVGDLIGAGSAEEEKAAVGVTPHLAARLEPEVLAHHCTQAGLLAPAVRYWGEAGKRALARSAWPGCRSPRVTRPGPALSSRTSTAGLPRASRPPI